MTISVATVGIIVINIDEENIIVCSRTDIKWLVIMHNKSSLAAYWPMVYEIIK